LTQYMVHAKGAAGDPFYTGLPCGSACQARARCRRWHAPLWPARQAAFWHAAEQ